MKKQSIQRSRCAILKGATLAATGMALGSGLVSIPEQQVTARIPARPNQKVYRLRWIAA